MRELDGPVGWSVPASLGGRGLGGARGAGGPRAHTDVRVANMSLVLRLLQGGPLPRTRIAQETGLSKASVSSLVSELCARGLLAEDAPDSSGGVGRPTTALRVSPACVAGVGLEVGPHSLVLTVVTLSGMVLHQESIRVEDPSHSPGPVLEQASRVLAAQVERLWAEGTTVPAVVLAQPGVLDHEHGTVRTSTPLGWHDVPVVALVRAELARLLAPCAAGRPLPALAVDNEARLAAVATYEEYGSQGVRDLLFVSGGQGIGAGIIADGVLLRGWLGITGEVGHMPMDPAGALCRCGRRGCWETLVGFSSLTSCYPAQDPVRDPSAPVEERVSVLRRRLAEGDADLALRLAQVQEHLERGLAVLVDVLNPQVIVLSGYLAAFPEVFVSPSARALEARRLEERAVVRVEASRLGRWAPARGAALVALERVLEDPTVVGQAAS